jgi:hypothetical protein
MRHNTIINDPVYHLSIYISMALQNFVGARPLFIFLIFYTFGRIPRTGDQLVAHRATRTQIFTPRVGFEPKIPVLKRAKTVHVLDCAATVLGTGIVHHNITHFPQMRYCKWNSQSNSIVFILQTY